VGKLGNTNNKYQDYLKNLNKHSIFLKEVDRGEVLNLLRKLDPAKSADISPKFIKLSALEFHLKLTQLFNLSFKLGKFPNLLKLAKIIPIFKRVKNGNGKLQNHFYSPYFWQNSGKTHVF